MKKGIVAVMVVAVVGAAAWFLLKKESPEEQIRKRLAKLCELVGKNPEESNSVMLLKTDRLQTLFADPIEISGDAHFLVGSHSTSEFASTIVRTRKMFTELELSTTDLTVQVTSPRRASVSFTAILRGEVPMDPGVRHEHFRQVSAKLVKQEDDWVFREFKLVKVMEK